MLLLSIGGFRTGGRRLVDWIRVGKQWPAWGRSAPSRNDPLCKQFNVLVPNCGHGASEMVKTLSMPFPRPTRAQSQRTQVRFGLEVRRQDRRQTFRQPYPIVMFPVCVSSSLCLGKIKRGINLCNTFPFGLYRSWPRMLPTMSLCLAPSVGLLLWPFVTLLDVNRLLPG